MGLPAQSAQCARHQSDPRERGFVFAYRNFVVRAAGKVIEHGWVESPAGFGFEITK
jgi:hypothetical protein